MKLENKVAVVTGAGSGMGKEIAKLYAKEGAKVIVSDINQQRVEQVVSEIEAAGGVAIGVVTNVAIQEEVEAMINTAVETYGSLDVLVNNAGIMDNFVPIHELTNELWERVISVNLTGPLFAARAALNVMLKQENGGVIVNNASVGGLFGTRGGSSYVAAKHGLIGLTKNIGAVYGKLGIRCNVIAPGGVNTNIGDTITEPNKLGFGALAKGTGEAPMGDPSEIARVALFLASSDSSFVNGTTIVADGGWTAS